MSGDKPKITDDLMRNELTAPKTGNTRIYDGTGPKAIRGFGARITAAGARSFILNYRLHGIEYRHTIGAYPAWTVLAAREEAKRLRRLVDQGKNPLEEKRELREAPTVKDLADR